MGSYRMMERGYEKYLPYNINGYLLRVYFGCYLSVCIHKYLNYIVIINNPDLPNSISESDCLMLSMRAAYNITARVFLTRSCILHTNQIKHCDTASI